VLSFPNLVVAEPTLGPILVTPRPTIAQSTALLVPTEKVEPTPTITPTRLPPYMYTTQSGDYLANLAARFGVKTSEIQSAGPVPAEGLINPGMLMIIPRVLGNTSPATRVLPDSEIVFSPTSLDLDIKAFVKKAGGYLNTYTEYIYNATHSGAEVVDIVARENSINPRLLLGLLDYESHWVTGQPGNLAQSEYPMGDLDINNRGLYKQLSWVVRQISIGYYGWRAGTFTTLTFPDQSTLRISPEVNAGTVALQSFFSKVYNQREWAGVLYSNNGFQAAYEKLFDNPWVRAQPFEPFFPPNTVQPKLELPFYYDRIWSFSGGPHPVWTADSPKAALDFAPGSTESGCITSQEWVLASAPGLVIRSDNGVVMIDLDGDGFEQTGWVLLYLHISSEKRVPLGTRVNLNDPLGHPSCEGGVATGTHFHFARKYNGEWILADGPLPFIIGGWRAHAGSKDYEGTLTKDGKTITACTCDSSDTKISRPKPSP
jgi:murein DD-endopeptidase MepM/ murein hydrolase activator NlpD